MSHPYSKRFYSAALTASSASVAVPAGKVWVVKSIDVFGATGGSTDNCGVRIGPTVYFWATQTNVLQASRVGHWEGMQVLAAGETLQINAGTGTWHISISGYELDAV